MEYICVGESKFGQIFFWHIDMLLCIAEKQGVFL